MATDISDRVREIAKARDISESEVFERAVERGVEDLWEDVVIGRYLDGDISREEAFDLVGRDTVVRAEREVEAIEADVEWGQNA